MNYLEYCIRSIKMSFIPWIKKFKLSILINFLLFIIFVFSFKFIDKLWEIDPFIGLILLVCWLLLLIVLAIAFNISYNDYLYKKERGYLK